MKIWGNGKVTVIFILLVLTIALSGYAHAAGLSISANIDGRSDLIIRGNTVQWHHYDNEAPGLSSYPPTQIATTINGIDWFPAWPVTGSDRRVDCNCDSDVYTSLVPILPPIAQTVTLNIVNARDAVYIVQQPSAANNYTLIVEFNDNPSGGAALYEIELFYEGSAGTLYLGDNGIETLYTINTTTAASAVVGSGECEGLAPGSDPSFLYCVNDDDTLYTISTSNGTRTTVGSMGGGDLDRGLAYNQTTGILYGSDNSDFGSINTSTGAVTPLASPPAEDTECLAADPNNNLIYGIDSDLNLVVYNVAGNNWNTIGATTIGSGNDCGLAFDATAGILYAVNENGELFSINPANATTTYIGDTGLGTGVNVGLAFVEASENNIASVPTMNEWGIIVFIVLAGLGAVYYLGRQRKAKS